MRTQNRGYELYQTRGKERQNAAFGDAQRESARETELSGRREGSGGNDVRSAANRNEAGGSDVSSAANRNEAGGSDASNAANRNEAGGSDVRSAANRNEAGGSDVSNAANRNESGSDVRSAANRNEAGGSDVRSAANRREAGGSDVSNAANRNESGSDVRSAANYNEEEGSDDNSEEGRDDGRAAKDNIDNFGVIGNAFQFESSIQYLTIIGSIEGHMVLPPQNKTTKYENIIPQLVAVEENPNIKGLLTILNTVGGDVEAGLAIAELLATLSKPTVSLVLGGGHSIGIPLATASRYSFVAESATMTMHPIRMTGMIIGAEQTYDYFKKMQDRIVEFIVRTSHAKKENVIAKMNATGNMANDVGTILYGEDAVEMGLIDEIGGLDAALRKLKDMISETEKKEEKAK